MTFPVQLKTLIDNLQYHLFIHILPLLHPYNIKYLISQGLPIQLWPNEFPILLQKLRYWIQCNNPSKPCIRELHRHVKKRLLQPNTRWIINNEELQFHITSLNKMYHEWWIRLGFDLYTNCFNCLFSDFLELSQHSNTIQLYQTIEYQLTLLIANQYSALCDPQFWISFVQITDLELKEKLLKFMYIWSLYCHRRCSIKDFVYNHVKINSQLNPAMLNYYANQFYRQELKRVFLDLRWFMRRIKHYYFAKHLNITIPTIITIPIDWIPPDYISLEQRLQPEIINTFNSLLKIIPETWKYLYHIPVMHPRALQIRRYYFQQLIELHTWISPRPDYSIQKYIFRPVAYNALI